MFRGNIDFVTRTHIEGWVYCTRLTLVGARVHAFVDDECVGSGVVDLFRQDLVEAGVGDGLGGFNFAITLSESHDPRELHIRVEDGNAIVRQPGSRVLPIHTADLIRTSPLGNSDSLEWMRARGWLIASQMRLLQILSIFGVHKQRITVPVRDSDGTEYWQFLIQGAKETLELVAFRSLEPAVRDCLTTMDLTKARAKLHAAFPTSPPVVALFGREKGCVNVVEGSHTHTAPVRLSAEGGIDYEFGDGVLLWLNLDCAFSIPIGGLPSGTLVIVPSTE
jgi:hypothetical protein